MSKNTAEARLQAKAKHRAAKQAKKTTLGQRAGILAASCAVLVGVGAAGQATSGMTPVSSTGSNSSTAAADSQMSIEKSEIRSNPAASSAPAAITVAPQAAEPAPAAPAPAPAAPAPAPAPEPAKAPEPAPAVAINDPAGAQAYAAGQLASFGWGPDQMQCLQTLWTKESDWTTTATNASSGAYGIVQSLPAEKMASAGADYLTNYRTQINWGLDYIKKSYQSPCGALNFHLAHNWY
jgi:hypothetical protein